LAQTETVPKLKVQMTEERKNHVIKETLEGIQSGVQINFSTNSDYFGNKSKLKKKPAPSSYAEIKKLKKKLCNCKDDINTYLEIGSTFNRLYQGDSARLYLGNAIGLCMNERQLHPQDRNLAYLEGNIYVQAGDYASGIATYEKIVEEYPKDTIARSFLTIFYMGTGDTAKFRQIAEDNFKTMPTELTAVFFYIMEKGISKVTEGEKMTDKNISLRKFVDLDILKNLPVENNDSTRYKDTWYSMMMYNGYLKFGLMNFDSTVVKDEMDFFKIGNEKELNEIIAYFDERSKEKNNQNAFYAYKCIALSHFLLGNFDNSINYLNKSIAAFPKDKGDFSDNNTKEQYNNIAGMYFLLKDTVNVIKSLENKIAKRPGIDVDPNDHVAVGDFYLMTKDFVKAKKNYESAIKINPYQVNAYVGLGSIEFKNKRYEEAIIPLTTAYNINPNEPNVYFLMAAIKLINGFNDEAWGIYKQLYDFYPDDEFLQEIMTQYYYH
jgi:tetratricopeptide (TPR) repeat protein